MIPFGPPDHEADPPLIEWVTHLTADRLPRLLELLEAWRDHVVAVIYLPFPGDADLVQQFSQALTRVGAVRRLRGSLVRPPSDTDAASRTIRLRYPINRMRNMALRRAIADFVLLTDADFLPSPSLASALLALAVPFLLDPTSSVKTAVAVPCFLLHTGVSARALRSSSLGDLLRSGHAHLTDENGGHGPHLMSMSIRPRATLFEIVYEPQFEPYLFARRLAYPEYDERFTDQGGDKQSHLAQANAAGWQLFGLSDAWLAHPAKVQDVDMWPADRERGPVSDDLGRDHFSSAQTDSTRFRYFEDFLPELVKSQGYAFRFPRGPAGTILALGRSHGRPYTSIAFGL